MLAAAPYDSSKYNASPRPTMKSTRSSGAKRAGLRRRRRSRALARSSDAALSRNRSRYARGDQVRAVGACGIETRPLRRVHRRFELTLVVQDTCVAERVRFVGPRGEGREQDHTGGRGQPTTHRAMVTHGKEAIKWLIGLPLVVVFYDFGTMPSMVEPRIVPRAEHTALAPRRRS